MTAPIGKNWEPSPELLAAYGDGELQDRDDLVLLGKKVEAWLELHPEAEAELADHRRLRQLWLETAPPLPPPSIWNAMWSRIWEVLRGQGFSNHRKSRLVRWAGVLSVSAASLALIFLFLPPKMQKVTQTTHALSTQANNLSQNTEEDPFPVALSSEVFILGVEEIDIKALPAGVSLPVQGTLELLAKGDVILTREQPEVRLVGTRAPMILVRLETEEDDN